MPTPNKSKNGKKPPAPLTHRLAGRQPAPEATPPTLAAQRRIVSDQITLWSNTLYNAQVQARVAAAVGNDKLQTEAQAAVEQAIRALDELQNINQELANEPTPQTI